MNPNIQKALQDIQNGKPIILVDELDRENEGDIVISSEKASKDNLLLAMNEARGLMCIACSAEIIDKLDLKPMVENSTDKNGTPFTVAVDGAEGTTTGMSVYDRLKTISVFVNENAKSSDLNRPGHLFPLRAKSNLLLDRKGHTEGSVLLMKMAGLKESAIIVEIMNLRGEMRKGWELKCFAARNKLTMISIEELFEEF